MAREKKADKLIRALAVAERMNSHYGEAACALHYTTPFTLTIAVLLSAQTTDAGVSAEGPANFSLWAIRNTCVSTAMPSTMPNASLRDRKSTRLNSSH